MAAPKPASRYSDVGVEPGSSFSLCGPSPDLKGTSSKLSSLKNMPPSSSGRRRAYFPTATPAKTYDASLVLAKNHPPTFGAMVKKFMEKGSNSKFGQARRVELAVPADAVAVDLKKAAGKGSGGGLLNLHRRLFNRTGSADRTPRKALKEVNNNTRTLGTVLRSERELLSQNKECEEEITELLLLLEERNQEIDKLKDLCLKQREEIKELKDAILFPDVINPRLQDLFERQDSELKEARKIIPSLQKQVSSLTGQIQCLAEDLAEVKADKYAAKNCFDGLASSPRTPTYDKEPQIPEHFTKDHLRIDDINPCLTPCFSKIKPKGSREEVCYNSPDRDGDFEDSSRLSPNSLSDSYSGMLSMSSERCQKRSMSFSTSKKVCKSDENKSHFGKPMPQNLF